MSFDEFVINIDLPRSPCRGCKNRRVGCHNAGQCREYDLFRQIAGAKAALESVGRLIDGKATDDELENFTYFFNRVVGNNGRLFHISLYGKNRRIREKARKRIEQMAIYRYAWYLWYTSIAPEEV